MGFDDSSSPSTCPFCIISSSYDALHPTLTSSAPPNALSPEKVTPNAHVVLSTPLVMAFLDIMPLSPGHLLVTTREHHEKISDVTEEESRELGFWLPVLSRVLAEVQGIWDWNIVQNNGEFCWHRYVVG